MSQLVRIGQIVGAFGLRGQVKVEPMTTLTERFGVGSRLRLRGNWVTVEASRIHKGRPLLKLEGVNDASAAEALQWEYLEGSEADRPDLAEGEYLVDDLVGMDVLDMAGRKLGKVDDVLPYPAQDILVVGETLIPMVSQFIKDVDLKTKQITVALIPGMEPEGAESATKPRRPGKRRA